MGEPAGSPRVRQRTVFYVMGFDPRGTAFYYGQLKREARISKRRGFSSMEVGPLLSEWEHGQVCQCKGGDPSQEVEIRYRLLSISDFVADYFRQPRAKTLVQALRLFAHIWLSGFVPKLAANTPKFALFTQYPYAVLLVAPLGGMLAGLLTTCAAPPWAGVIAGVIAATALLALILKQEHRLYVMYLLGDFLFSSRALTNPSPALQQRRTDFSNQILQALQQNKADEEILIVGHSSGALLAIQLAASVLRRLPGQYQHRLSLLTLGNQASLAYLRDADSFRQDVATLLRSETVYWRDIFAPQDVISSGRFDYAEKLSINSIKSNTYVLSSARLKEAVAPRTYDRLKYAFLKLHMQYLRASETGNGFNYFKLLESPCRLSEFRF